ncbi:hypothetical protein [Wenxinia marina]|uniref:Wenxma_21, whole genome shotgun sequence n=1 Tax=Wenxinia marina DSM 24838 TaxID=1123501 RepID=A0A0D0NGN1_9RHOB|nr:hypothetical protein [Wenxinia marina]KIQ67480.1 hypothetical protein Wenmar_03903 [Wenxinia marina DSM 24838]GGL69198.1 hypothetical protein GCM10011392_24550 [Wenxinia marina]
MDKTRLRKPACLVLVRHEVIAEDLALTLQDAFGKGPIMVCRSPEEALERLPDVSDLQVAVVETDPDTFAGSRLETEITARGGQVVLFGELAETRMPAGRWPVLHRPFTDEMVLNLLSRFDERT